MVSSRNAVAEIPYDLIESNDPSSTTILTETPPGRGTLTSSGRTYSYQPDPSFFEVGLDSFRYTSAAQPGYDSTVYLVAGLDRIFLSGNGAAKQGGVCALETGWQLSNSSGGVSFTNGPDDSCVINFDGTSGVETRIVAPDDIGPSPAGGHTDIVLDTGGGSAFGSADPDSNLVAFATAAGDSTGPAVFGLRLINDSEIQLIALRSNGDYASTDPVSIGPGQHKVGITWWFQTSRRLGGIVLEVDGRIVGSHSQVDNGASYGTFMAWQMGPRDFVGSGDFTLSDLSIWVSLNPAQYPPQFSDNGHQPLAWSRVIDEPQLRWVEDASGDPAWHLDLDGTSGALLVDDTVAGLENYHARLALDLDQLIVPNGARLNVFGATHQPGGSGGGSPFRIELRRSALGALQLRGVARSDGLENATAWIDVPAQNLQPVVEVQWQATKLDSGGATLSNGRFAFGIDGMFYELPGLDNQLSLRDVKLGPNFADAGVAGTMIVDAFDAWQ